MFPDMSDRGGREDDRQVRSAAPAAWWAVPRAPRARDPAASASQEQGSSLSLRRDGRSSNAEDGPALA